MSRRRAIAGRKGGSDHLWGARALLFASLGSFAFLAVVLARIPIQDQLVPVVFGCLSAGLVGCSLSEPFLHHCEPSGRTAVIEARDRWRAQLLVLTLFACGVALTGSTGSLDAGAAGIGFGMLAVFGRSPYRQTSPAKSR